jgi:N-acetylneuraminic acid mutarotase
MRAGLVRLLGHLRRGVVLTTGASLLLSACGGGGGSAPQQYTLSAMLSGVTAAGLSLTVNGASVSVAPNSTTAHLSTALTPGTAYQVTVQTQPSGLNCVVTNGSGTMPATDVSSVAIACQVPTFTLSATVNGLTASGLVLSVNGAAVSVASSASTAQLSASLTAGTAYQVTIQTMPSGLSCGVSNGSGTMPASDLGNVAVGCQPRGWIWQNGSTTHESPGVYGSIGVAAAANTPGARQMSASWTDAVGNLWLFGGRGPNNGADFNDLWSYSPGANAWTWISGSNAVNAVGVYGARNTAASGNMPGARDGATSWSDTAGNLWLFGGEWYDGSGGQDYFNDLWKYDPASDQWTWISGASAPDAAGSYGVQGTPAAANSPGARTGAISWRDAAGNLWLFGGWGYDGAGNGGYLADLWEFDVATGQWSWISGADTANASATYGSQGVATAGTVPGARKWAVSWTDAAGNFWLFGGYGYDSTGAVGDLGDLWRYETQSGQWVWVNGSNTMSSTGVYGTQGVAATANIPGARDRASAVTDGAGNLWLFGGEGFATASQYAFLDDLWEYDVAVGEWIWVSGSPGGNDLADYGTQTVYSATNSPGARYASASWIDFSGRFWLFGGMACKTGTGTCVSADYTNDLWSD